MPEYIYIPHKVKKGETLWGIAKQYNAEEHKILQANPEVKISSKGNGKYEIANLKEGQILRIPQLKKTDKRGVKTISGNTFPKAGIKEKYRVTEWYAGTPQEMKNPTQVKWAVYYKEKDSYTLKLKKESGEFIFHEQAIGKNIKIVGYLYSPELDNDSALPVKVSSNKQPSITSLVLYDINKDKPLPKNAKLKLGQAVYAVAHTTNSIGKKVKFSLFKKEEKEGETEYATISEIEQEVSSKGTATTAFLLNDFSLLVSSQKKHHYRINAQLEGADTTYVFDNKVEVEKDNPFPKQPEKKEESIIYKGAAALREGWNKVKETYKKMTTSEEPQIQKVSLYIPEGKKRVSYGEILKLKVEGKYLKDQTIEYTVYEDDGPAKDELDNGMVRLAGDVQEIEIQLTQEMYKKGGTSWFELMDGKHEIYVDVKLKGKILAKSTGIIEVDTSTMEVEKLPGNRPVTTGEPDKMSEEKEEDCVCKQYDLIWGAKVSCEFRKKVVEISEKLGLPQKDYEGANWLMAVMALETGDKNNTFFTPKVGTFKHQYENNISYDGNAGYVGLIQFGKDAAKDIGTTRAKLYNMSAEQQLDYVYKFYSLSRFKDKLRTITDLYLAVNYPVACGYGEKSNHVVYAYPKTAYDSNPQFKREKHEFYIDKKGIKRFYTGQELKDKGLDATSYVWEFTEAINEFYELGKKYKTKEFTCQQVSNITKTGTKTKKKYDIDKAVAHLNRYAEPKSTSYCARYVRQAIEAGGLSTEGRPISACDYDSFLPTLGFSKISSENYTPIKGDIIVIEAFQGDKKYHKHGHIAMYNGTQWVSDFKQRDMWAGPDYRKHKPKYTFFRWIE